MRDPFLPILLLGAGAGLASCSTVRTIVGIGCGTLALYLLALISVPGRPPTDTLFVLAWIGVGVSAALAWLPPPSWMWIRIAVASLTGLLAGGLSGTSPAASAPAFFGMLACAASVGVALSRRGWPLPPRIVASWLVAIAILNAALVVLPVTPGYLPDHLE